LDRKERLQKYLSRHGVASRRASEEIIASGKVKVNGVTVVTPGTKINPSEDRVEVDGKKLARPEKKVYILLNKPRDYISTVSDPAGRKKITDLLDGVKERVYPVGRLDYDSEGLILLTNDGDFTFHLTHPKYNVSKTYRVRVKGTVQTRDLNSLSSGIMLDDGMTAPAQVSLIDERDGNSLVEITIGEGRNRQVRRMFEKVGYEVIRLKRIKIANLSLGLLKSGQYRFLSGSEIFRLKKAAGIKDHTKSKKHNMSQFSHISGTGKEKK